MTDLRMLIPKIAAQIKKTPFDASVYDDLYSACVNLCKQTDRGGTNPDYRFAHDWGKQLVTLTAQALQDAPEHEQRKSLYEVYRKALKYDAVDNFDSFMLYLELDRPADKRFYQPRRRVLKRFVDALQALEDDELDELHMSCPPRVGKLIADSTPVLTKDGWKRHGDLKVGDVLYRPDGKETRVIAVHPKYHTTHTVEFADGSKIKCHANHEWKVIRHGVPGERIVETNYMIDRLETGGKEKKRGHRYNFALPLRQPIQGTEKELPVKPYTFGAWLGDGTSTKPWLNGPQCDECIAFRAEKDGYPISKRYVHKTTGVLSIQFDGLRKGLQKIGFCNLHNNPEKYIPEIYLTASLEQRLELLAGLLDTDGSLTLKEKRYHFSTTSVPLRDTFIQLISTFGWRVSVESIEPKLSSSGIQGRKTVYQIGFNPDIEIPTVVPRKHLTEFSKRRKTAITAIYESEPEQGNCITVEGDGMYLVGENMIPTHNSSLTMFFILWIMGRDSERSNLYCSYSDIITAAFYNGIVEVLNDGVTYLYKDIFPDAPLVNTNSKDEYLDLGRRKRYHSLTARSLYGTLNGACDASGYIIADDLISGIEEALNADRLKSAWDKVNNNLLTRGKEKTKIIFIGTRWSLADPIGVRRDLLMNDDKFKYLRAFLVDIPALDENERSNFDYEYGVGFSTEKYQAVRASFERTNDLASWDAQYMQKPIERSGSLFEPDGMRYYNGELPDVVPDMIIAAVDPAYGGGDFVAMPVAFVFGSDVYIHDVVYDNEDKKITVPECVEKIVLYGITACQIEGTKSTSQYADEVQEELKRRGQRIRLTTKAASTATSKQDRIFKCAPDIRDNFVFKASGKRSKEYQSFMENVFAFKIAGKNKHDDAPDSLAMLSDMIFKQNQKVEVFRRTF